MSTLVSNYFVSLSKLYLPGEKLVSPGAKRGLIPLVVPLAESPAGLNVFQIG
jgi:hypothetical protein